MKEYHGKLWWNSTFREGGWDFLDKRDERIRYLIIGDYINHVKKAPSVLDVGCGHGLLAKMIEFKSYLGTDLSEEAIKKAKKANSRNKRVHFIAIGAEDFITAKKFDVIVFNEVLYCLKDYKWILHKLSKNLTANGVFVVSISDNPKHLAIWRYLEKQYHLLYKALISNVTYGWRISVFTLKQPKYGARC